MKKITLLLSLLLCSYYTTGQVLNQDANWPNTSWDLDGSYETDAAIFTGNPTVTGGSSSFSFDEDEAGGSSINNIGVQSPTINLTNAFNAGEYSLVVTSTYVLNVYQNESLNLQYWNADASTWVNWGPTYTVDTPGAPTVDFCSGTRAVFNSGELDIAGFSSNQLQNFRYRIYYNDNGSYGWGICFDSPNIQSIAPPNCANVTDIHICNLTHNAADIYWSPGSNEVSWQVAIQAQGAGEPTSSTSTSTNSYMASGLSANSNYEIYIRAQCLDGTGFSSWVTLAFTTNDTPLASGVFAFTQNNSISMFGTSYAVVDMNSDGLDDMIAASATSLNITYQSSNGCYNETVYNAIANYGPGWSIAAGDLDGNGYNDLLYAAGNGVSFMLANADGTSYSQSYNTSDYVFSQRSNFIDINNDGNLDAFVCHDVEPNVYFINDGSGGLSYYQGASTNVPNGLGVHPNGGNYGTVWVDYDNDGDADMFIAKCRGGNVTHKINELWRNDGNGVFVNVAADTGVNLADPVQTWSSAWADFDNDGDMDAYIGASSSSDGSHKYMLNNGDGTFTDATATANVSSAPYGIENAPADFNNDGYVDILSNGQILLNNGDNSFTVTSSNMPPSGAIGDLNNDGFLDVFKGSLYLNNPNQNNWIKIRTQGTTSNTNGIGARIEIVTPSGNQIRDVRSGEGFEFMSTLNAHFGIGTDTEITSLTITWPSGIVDVIFNPAINETITTVEGENLSVANNTLEADIVIYPNPTKDIVHITSSVALNHATYTIYDITGKQVLNANLIANTIDVSKLSTGIYVLKIMADGKQKTQKLVKQ
ncbi:FG-GAP-like repeat-containing protein [Lacinutrix gracilariae]|uniref:FG-GAP-like repeat-containing protein n=1 Tax=Lacinutrix gracilariae TaxID=1747198 RepID=A0ABW5K260_9FLAO